MFSCLGPGCCGAGCSRANFTQRLYCHKVIPTTWCPPQIWTQWTKFDSLQIEEKWNGKWIFATPATPFHNAISERLVSTIKQAMAKDYTPYLVETHLVGPNLVGHIWSNPNLVRSNLVQPTFGPTNFWSNQIWSNPNLVQPNLVKLFFLLSMC